MSQQAAISPKNRLLLRLGEKDLALLIPHMQRVNLEQRTVLYDVGESLSHVYFMEEGVASIIAIMENGSTIEVGMVGPEGMVSVSALLGDKTSKQHVVIQLSGVALKVHTKHCIAVFEQSAHFRDEILHFASAVLALNAQTSACNRLHSVEQRFARWLLMSADRFQSDTLPLTQDYLATMLGVRRPGVSETAGDLQRSGLIANSKGKIQIIDREGLEQAACECYRSDRQRFDDLMS
ncbi:MAG: hypothetical protein JWO78_6 [Micavibrio sp.]|nr:hypothetical protein [Micavibrio sp.]